MILAKHLLNSIDIFIFKFTYLKKYNTFSFVIFFIKNI